MANAELAAEADPATVESWARRVLDGERQDVVSLSVTFLPETEMHHLNASALGRDHATDVIAFRLTHVDRLAGDIYICPAVARRAAAAERVPAREELLRLVVHGVLHVLGHDHPEGEDRTRSPMWIRQEDYVARLAAGGDRDS
ncbi:MAG: rRNA maturation RNase YbeY [Gemmatimonadota bacterium]|nr:rRNA maturation RNase YbeY [Gemmatimonadota bacterium]MDH3368099.1 rRNA maturation RNase YbeY [Gemmatimonadota bacterium]MDH3478300.1 rRNA maturation RNase YbeY [Gemmatimonadota bacterium]MDH5550587.1 rRNA maturation RNase YbeY [Gemmatimonadota bacterium]